MHRKFRSLFCLLVSVFFLFNSETKSQSPDWLWAKSLGGSGYDHGRSIAIDADANLYTTGVFRDTMDFDPGAGVFNLISAGNNDIFISKLDSAGNFVWAKRIGNIYADWGTFITTDSYGNVYTTGTFYDTVDFDPGPGVFNLSGVGDFYILKLDSAGNFIYAKSATGPACADIGGTMIIDDELNIYTTGQFCGVVDFDPGPGLYNLTSIGSGINIFILKLDSTGSFVWAKQFNGEITPWGKSIAFDQSGNLCVAGYFEGSVDFDPGPATYNLSSSGYSDIFIAKLDSSGNFIWAKQMGGAMGVDEPYSIVTDDLNNIYTTGNFRNTSDFDPDPTATLLYSSNGWEDIFISKLDSSGNLVWAKTIGSVDPDRGYYISLDNSGNIYLTGLYGDTMDFDPGVGVFDLTASAYSAFVLKLDSGGNFVWAKASAPYFGILAPSFLELDNSGKAYVMGTFFLDSAAFGPHVIYNLGLDGEIFIAKLNDVLTGIEEHDAENTSLIYPNPATDYFFINLTDNRQKYYQITISDIAGKIIYNSTNSEVQNTKISISEFRSGLYFVQIKSPDFVVTNKLVIEHQN